MRTRTCSPEFERERFAPLSVRDGRTVSAGHLGPWPLGAYVTREHEPRVLCPLCQCDRPVTLPPARSQCPHPNLVPECGVLVGEVRLIAADAKRLTVEITIEPPPWRVAPLGPVAVVLS